MGPGFAKVYSTCISEEVRKENDRTVLPLRFYFLESLVLKKLSQLKAVKINTNHNITN